jgi:hypothetical protein
VSGFIHSSMALQPFVGPWPLLRFRNHFYTEVGILGGVISPSQSRYLHAGQHKHKINAHTNIHALSEIRTHDPRFRASEDSSCLRPRGHRDRQTGSSAEVGISLCATISGPPQTFTQSPVQCASRHLPTCEYIFVTQYLNRRDSFTFTSTDGSLLLHDPSSNCVGK